MLDFTNFFTWALDFIVDIGAFVSDLWAWLTTPLVIGKFTLTLPFNITWTIWDGFSFIPISILFGGLIFVLLGFVLAKKIIPLF